MQNIISDKKCTSCMACYSACPAHAIEIYEDKDKFFTPFINEDKCTNCGLCKKICPVLNENRRSFAQKTEPKIYACAHKDDDVRIKSASGGMFSVIADYVLANNGYICGAVYDYDNDKIVKHIVSNKPEDLDKMRKSKYVQSYIGDCFKQIKELLDDNRLVLFSGTPCQVAGLNASWGGGREYENLITIDLCCHSVIPQYMLKEYIKDVTKENCKKISKIDMRYKITNWSSYSFLIEWIDRNDILRKCYEPFFNTIFFKGFLENLWKKNSCNKCIYATPKRKSDFTIGDFWGIEKFDKTLNDEKGLSIVILNTDKSKKIFEQIKGNLKICSEVEYNSAIATQCVLNGNSFQHHRNRDLFFKYVSNHYSPLELTKDLLGINKVKILTYDGSHNYGAQLQSWALCEKIKQLGFDPVVIKRDLSNVNNSILEFRNRAIPMTATCYTEEEFAAELSDCNRVIIGGDQMFRHWSTDKTYPYLRGLCDWVYGNCLIAGYGSSFGINFFNGDEYLTNECKKLLKRCDKLTVREKSGIDILKNTFDVVSKEVVDPALLLTSEEYSNLIDKKNLPQIKYDYIAYCVLDGQLGLSKINEELKNKLNDKLINICADANGNYNSPEAWLNYIKNAKFVITDSFHCVVFAIIFKKPFVVIGRRDYEIMERINNLLDIYNLQSQKKSSLNEITNDDINDNIDWNNVYKILEKNRVASEKELLEILLMKPTYKEKYVNNELKTARLKSELEYKAQKHKIVYINKKVISIENIFSVQNEYSNNIKRKVITILGLKIKFKSL